jgi:hypothetical protein
MTNRVVLGEEKWEVIGEGKERELNNGTNITSSSPSSSSSSVKLSDAEEENRTSEEEKEEERGDMGEVQKERTRKPLVAEEVAEVEAGEKEAWRGGRGSSRASARRTR